MIGNNIRNALSTMFAAKSIAASDAIAINANAKVVATTAASVAGDATKTASASAAAAATKTIATTTAMSQIMIDAKTAAAGAYAATVEIPILGLILAPIAAAAAFAGVMAFGAIGSAEGGWDRIPENQLAMVHKNEMVLPAALAENIRRMSAGSPGMTGGSTSSTMGNTVHTHTHNWTVQAWDGKDVKRVLDNHKHLVSSALLSSHRDGGIKIPRR